MESDDVRSILTSKKMRRAHGICIWVASAEAVMQKSRITHHAE
jgi:hypothetical protein